MLRCHVAASTFPRASGHGSDQVIARSLSARMLVVSASFAVVLVGAFVILVLAIDAQRAAGRTALRAQEAIAAGRALEATALSLDNGVRGYVITGRRGSLAPYDAARRAYPRRLAALRGLLSGSRDEARHLQRIGVGIKDYV